MAAGDVQSSAKDRLAVVESLKDLIWPIKLGPNLELAKALDKPKNLRRSLLFSMLYVSCSNFI